MRFHAKGAHLTLLLFMVATPATLAQEAHQLVRKEADRPKKPSGFQLLTLTDGLAILGAALGVRHPPDFPSDCSHLVHELYGRAGFPYEYASSLELYTGIDEFRRVTSPQPGDLAVWRGHTGIVVNPAQHSFFSVLSSGPSVDSYDSPYWKQRGRPHFYRYVKGVPNGGLSSATFNPGDNKERRKTAAENPVVDVSKESSIGSGTSSKAEIQPRSTTTPRFPVINSVRPKPDQIGAVFLQACQDWAESLRARDLIDASPSQIVFSHFEVEKVHITGDQGWVEIQINEVVSLSGSKAEARKRSERIRWSLSRLDTKSWELTPSRNTIYISQHTAERILAHELAQLTEDTPDNDGRAAEKAQLARLLNVLLKE
jgi:hypothetical protein